jgi:hypothetical protein
MSTDTIVTELRDPFDTMATELRDSFSRVVEIFTPKNAESVPEEDCAKNYEQTIQTIDKLEHQLILQIESVVLPKRLLSEDIAPPTIECKKKAQSIVSKLHKNFSIHPGHISASIEEGIFIKYTNYENQRDLSIEIYNDLNVAAIVTENEETITSRDIYDESFSEIYRTFYSPSMPKTPSL